jgi:hypothetical protein
LRRVLERFVFYNWYVCLFVQVADESACNRARFLVCFCFFVFCSSSFPTARQYRIFIDLQLANCSEARVFIFHCRTLLLNDRYATHQGDVDAGEVGVSTCADAAECVAVLQVRKSDFMALVSSSEGYAVSQHVIDSVASRLFKLTSCCQHTIDRTSQLQDEGDGPALPASVTANTAIREATATLLLRSRSTAQCGVSGEASARAGKRRRVETDVFN